MRQVNRLILGVLLALSSFGSYASVYENGDNVGINTTTPTETLDVNGNVKATQFIGDGSQLTGVLASEQHVELNIPEKGWYRVARITGAKGRGQNTVTVYTKGGDYTPSSTTIRWFHDWSEKAGLTVISESGSEYWSEARVTDEGDDSYLEIYFKTKASRTHLTLRYEGGYAQGNLISTVQKGGGNVRATAPLGLFAVGNVVVDVNGNVGIGTDDPLYMLDVNGPIQNDGIIRKSGIVYVKSTGNETRIGPGGSGSVSFHNSGTMTTGDETMRITESGHVGIGTSAPNRVLHIKTSEYKDDFVLNLQNDVSTAVLAGVGMKFTQGKDYNSGYIFADREGNYANQSNADSGLAFATAKDGVDDVKMYISSDGNVGVGTSEPNGKLHVTGGNDKAGVYSRGGGASGSINGPAFFGIVGSSNPDTRILDLVNSNGSVMTLSEKALFVKSNVGIGTSAPTRSLHLYSKTPVLEIEASNDSHSRLILDAGAASDAQIEFEDNNLSTWTMGMDSSDANGFVIANSGSLGSGNKFKITTGGNVGIGLSTINNEFEVYGSGSNPRMTIKGDESISTQLELGFQYGSGVNSSLSSAALIYAKASQAAPNPIIADLVFLTNSGDSVTEKMRITGAGNVGIGTNSPGPDIRLYVRGSGSSEGRVRIEGGNGGAVTNATLELTGRGGGGEYSTSKITSFGQTGNGASLAFLTENSSNSMVERMRIDQNGRLGVGTATPTEKLHVKGNVKVDGVVYSNDWIVNTGTWADFVFDDTYSLLPLNELEQFVKENKHLPNIPSEEKVLSEGVSVKNMQVKLLQKVEELTLYVIDQQKQIDDLKEKNRLLMEKLGG